MENKYLEKIALCLEKEAGKGNLAQEEYKTLLTNAKRAIFNTKGEHEQFFSNDLTNAIAEKHGKKFVPEDKLTDFSHTLRDQLERHRRGVPRDERVGNPPNWDRLNIRTGEYQKPVFGPLRVEPQWKGKWRDKRDYMADLQHRVTSTEPGRRRWQAMHEPMSFFKPKREEGYSLFPDDPKKKILIR